MEQTAYLTIESTCRRYPAWQWPSAVCYNRRTMIPEVETIDSPSLQVQDLQAEIRTQVAAIAGGDETALASFYDATIGRVYGLAIRIVGDAQTAEEVAADVYFQVWREAARYDRERAAPLTWLLTICRSRALDALRRRDRAELQAEPEPPQDLAHEDNGPLDLLLAIERESRLHAALVELAPLQRQLVALAFFRGLTHQEIANYSGMALGTVKTHIRNALLILQRAVQRQI